MPQPGYLASALWQTTLAARERDEHSEQRERLRTSYLSLREHTAVLMAEAPRDALPFTVHDITHVDALWETADLVCGNANLLTPAEAYVLGCAFVLHDAAMCLAAYKEGLPATVGDQQWRDLLSVAHFNQLGRWPSPADIESPPQSIVDACYAQAIRETHPAHAARLVDERWQTSSGNEFFLIQDVQLREWYGPLIGELAASHWWGIGVLYERFKRGKGSMPPQPPEWIIDPLKLACVLRLADATQIDSRRSPTFLLSLRQPKGESANHWRFQEHASRPQLHGDRITFSSMRPFAPDTAGAWWLALDYLREVDRELKKVDALLHDLARPRLAARAVAGVDSEERFAELFPVSGWRPVDAVLQVSDVARLVETLGGQQLYGKDQSVAIRELLQNAHDAVVARKTLDDDFAEGRVEVRLTESDGTWVLEVRDNGIGMDEDIVIHGLLDFGRSGWSIGQMRRKFPGLAGGGFQPKGRFGIGFFSVFMLGDDIEIVTRRFDGALTDARRIRFSGLDSRPIVTTPGPLERTSQGTVLRVTLRTGAYDTDGLLHNDTAGGLIDMVQRLIFENAVPIHVTEAEARQEPLSMTIEPFALATGSAEEVFDRLYPPRTRSWQTSREKYRLLLREEFAARATKVFDAEQRTIGLAAINSPHNLLSRFSYWGTVPVNGFFGDRFYSFLGYFDGKASRASRDKVDLVADSGQLRNWLESQEQRLKDLGLFTRSVQVQLADTFYTGLGRLADDRCIGLTCDGPFHLGDIEDWADMHDEIFLAIGWPLYWNTFDSEPRLWHITAAVMVDLPDGWLAPYSNSSQAPFSDVFPSSQLRDPNFEYARTDREQTWQKVWWQLSGSIEGALIRRICEVWGCGLGDVLGPVADRHWDDAANLGDEKLTPVYGYWLRRP